MIRIRRIMCPVDFSEPARRALDYALDLAGEFRASILLFHVMEPIPSSPFSMPYADDNELQFELPRSDIEEKLSSLVEQVHPAGVEVSSQVVEGVPHREIVQRAEGWDADLLVMGTHGRSGLIHALMGSTAERVVQKAKCPVLTIRPPGQTFALP